MSYLEPLVRLKSSKTVAHIARVLFYPLALFPSPLSYFDDCFIFAAPRYLRRMRAVWNGQLALSLVTLHEESKQRILRFSIHARPQHNP